MALVLPGQHGITESCKFCDKTFMDKPRSSLNRHEKICAKNPQRKNWHCTVCARTFANHSGMFKHKLSKDHIAKGGILPVPRLLKKNRLAVICVPPVVPSLGETVLAAKTTCLLTLSSPTKNYHANKTKLEDLPDNYFDVIMADPPFHYNRSVGQGVAKNHYETMRDEDLKKLPVSRKLKENALLFLWCSGPTMASAIDLCSHWGFVYKTMAFVWVKTNKAGQPQSMGLGSYTKPGTEFVLLATRGRGKPLISERLDQVFVGKRGAHSEKPTEIRSLVDRLTGHSQNVKKLELFSRRKADASWSVWGDQIDKLA